ncbi:hypothetical protein BX616_004664 [Lobosporangium transversale]|uniref:MYND-type domain-containing protein n=1 Tax=Lobosporangium transversale TaxID=64571 RepID=A0A1Y2GTK1_9FUNG|nr:hypothetical protein BCR41DRAFT_349730 [Lobosporangium transversale]KAF9897987.1 hypothetical protein BX616_004664 [Lobosporangium transversale]ORZ22821.1 hypothetical protein BCR41DRAFT_349730 [Lobosporangium transversale]|eukprot:XP_021883375.1 hypothetical protein BCR41DRAFT_349730 [Lobosporangium transversale]
MTDVHPAPAVEDATVAEVTAATNEIALEDKSAEHVHGPDCDHDHEHDHEQQQALAGQRHDYDLLEVNGTKDKTTDPLVKKYFEAKELFAKANERLDQIPEGTDAELIEKHKDEIVSVTKDLMQAFLLDDKACLMNQRILKLAEQYEAYVQANNPEGTSTATADSEEEGAEQQTTVYTRDSVIFVIMILWSGGQYEHCIQTLTFAIQEFEPLKGRLLELRANCYMALRNFKACNDDFEEALTIEPVNVENHSTLGNIFYVTHQAQDALHHFKEFVAVAHPDSRTLPNAYYALSILTLLSAPSNATKKKSNQALKQAAALKEAQEYFKKAQEADVRFKELYGVMTGYNDIKRTAIQAFQIRTATRSGLISTDPTAALLEASELLKKSFKNPGISSCANCGRPDNVANQGRSQELKPKPLIKCNKCNKVAYCSRPCQIAHWNATHKNACKK